MAIHPTALVDPKAELAEGVKVGPFVVIEGDVVIGEGSDILTGSTILAGTRLGRQCRIGPYASLGGTPMDRDFRGEPSYVVLEDHVEVREYASLHRATGEGLETRIAEATLIMPYVHITHNCRVGREVTLVTSVLLAGHVVVEDYAFLSAGTMVHQFCRIGAYAITAAQSGVLKDILPFMMAQGTPARHFRLNKVGLERRGIVGERYKLLEQAVRAFRKRDTARLSELASQSADVQRMLDFKASSQRGLSRFVRG